MGCSSSSTKLPIHITFTCDADSSKPTLQNSQSTTSTFSSPNSAMSLKVNDNLHLPNAKMTTTSKSSNWETSFEGQVTQIQRYQQEYEKLSLRERISLNFSKVFKFKTHVTLSQEAFNKEYLSLEKIGTGGEAHIYKVFHKPTNQYRATKVSHKSSEIKGTGPDRPYKNLLQEAKILSSLDHPNIIKVHEILQDANEATLVLEYLEGKSLLRHINNPLFQTYEAIATIMEQILSALSYIHGRGIIHKDIKLENILFEAEDPFSNLKIIDFGYAEVKDKMYKRSSSGTLMYMASEVFTMDYNEKCDLWAVGVILYLLIFKEVPFKGNTSEDLVEDIFNKDLNEMFKKHRLLCQEPLVIPFLQKLLEREPSKRYSATDALKDPFIRKYARKPKVQGNDIEFLKVYQSKSAMELVLSSVYVHNLMTVAEKSQLITLFKALDTSRRGYICEDDFKTSDSNIITDYSANQGSKEKKQPNFEVSKLMIAAVDLKNRNLLRKVFGYLSKENSMMIKTEEMYLMLENYIDVQILEEIKEQFKKENKQELTYWDFDDMIKSL